ncbi:MAG: hypothetical protein QM535_00135 [Limnohabitans sp.]|nr:hypothetical protein [Limnohabitans sp.]
METTTAQEINFKVETINTNGPINFPHPRSTEPFPPIVQSYFEGTQLEVSAIILLPYGQQANFQSVTSNNNTKSLEFYINYLAAEKAVADFAVYQVTFYYPIAANPGTITTFVRDEDPVTSRGTQTSVQP